MSAQSELLSDHALAVAAGTHDPAAFKVVLQRFGSLIRKTAHIYFRSTTDVDDCQQEVNFALFQRLPMLRNPASIRPFIIAVTSRIALYQLHKHRVARRAIDRPVADVDELVAPVDVEASHALNRVKALLLRMQEREREPFVLRLGAGMNIPEIAEATGMSEPTVRRKVKRAARHFSQLARRDIFVAHYLSDTF